MLKALKICQEQGLENFVLQFDRDYPLTLPLGASSVAADDLLIPPLKVHLRAQTDGSLRSILLEEKTIPAMAQLKQELLRIQQQLSETEQKQLEVDLIADAELLTEEYGKAYGILSENLTGRINIFSGPIDEEIEELQISPTDRHQ